MDFEVRRFGACMADDCSFAWLRLSGAIDPRQAHRKTRAGRIGGALAGARIEIGSTSRTEPLAIFATERARGQSQYQLFHDQRRQVYLLALIYGELELFVSKSAVGAEAGCAGCEDEAEIAGVKLAKVLGASSAGSDRGGFEAALEEEFHPGAIEFERDGDRAAGIELTHGALAQQAIHTFLRHSEADFTRLGGNFVDP
ncbi:MAG TPA: hypothetical protein VNF45_07260 [Candidatus Binataceae bacterium]|nr:hypothetical protein [Candidatus Binataceae bacterium]